MQDTTHVRHDRQDVTRDELVEFLNEDLAGEYQAIISYVIYSQVIKGAQFMNIAAELELHAAGDRGGTSSAIDCGDCRCPRNDGSFSRSPHAQFSLRSSNALADISSRGRSSADVDVGLSGPCERSADRHRWSAGFLRSVQVQIDSSTSESDHKELVGTQNGRHT